MAAARRRAIVFALAASVVGAVAAQRLMAPGEDASLESDLARLKDAVEMYRITFGTMPESIGDLGNSPDGSDPVLERAPIDPWGRPYRLRRGPGSEYRIESAGPDGVFEPDDERYH